MPQVTAEPNYTVYQDAQGLFCVQKPSVQNLFGVNYTLPVGQNFVTAQLVVQVRLENQHINPYDTGYPVLLVEITVSTWNAETKRGLASFTDRKELPGNHPRPRNLERAFQDFVFGTKDQMVELLGSGHAAMETAEQMLSSLDSKEECAALFPWLENQANVRQSLMQQYIPSPPR